MKSKLHLVFTIAIIFYSFYGSAQNAFWVEDKSAHSIDNDFVERFEVKRGMVFDFEEQQFQRNLKDLTGTNRVGKLVDFPDETGKMTTYKVTEASVFAPELAAKYPGIKSYVGLAVDDSGARINFSVSHKGVQSMMVHPDGKPNSFIQKGSNGKYVVYSRDSNSIGTHDFICATEEVFSSKRTTLAQRPVDDQELRKFRIAVTASGEYTQYHGGTVADAMAAINATITRVNGVFEVDLGVRLEIIANNDTVVYDDPATDPYNGNSTAQVQSTLTNNIGEANYDVGILFSVSPQGDGNAGSIGNVCIDNDKGSCYASFPTPEGDVFDIDFVAHEIGHQFGANHTWSFESEGTGVQFEPGSGTTIMGYAGITGGNNVAQNSDDYFHYGSIIQISEYLATVSCAEVISLTNNPPVITPTGNFTIPKSTAFVLTGSATDADASDVLTYSWEQIDNGVVTNGTFGPTNALGANFRSQIPNVSPERYFPKLSSVMAGMLTQENPNINTTWETVSDIEREMNFALTVRDNVVGAGQVAADLVNVFVEGNAGPFVVTSQTETFVGTSGAVETITWDVANTNIAPVNAQNVDILLSINGGITFPIMLAENVVNDGSHDVILPGVSTANARIMIKASDNIFFAVNPVDFEIQESEIVLNFPNLEFDVCQPDDLTIPFTYESYLGFSEEVTFSVASPPAGLGASFAPATATATDTPVQLSLSNIENVAPGNYSFSVVATAASNQKEVVINLNIYDGNFNDVVLVSPMDGLADASKFETLEWMSENSTTSYDIEIATDAGFTNIVESESSIIPTSYSPTNLMFETTYFWRVRPKNSCGVGAFSSPFSFTTVDVNCATKAGSGFPEFILTSGPQTVTSSIVYTEDLIIADMNVTLDILHTFISDLEVTLTSPQGTVVSLFSSSCGNLQDVNATFDDQATNAISCSTNGAAISGTVKPLGFLSAFNGESIKGEWILTVQDNANEDGGSIENFSLEACVEGQFRPDDDNDGVFDDGDDLCLGTPAGTPVDTSGCPFYKLPTGNFTILAQSESCRTNNDGMILIRTNENLDYTVQITGNGVDLTDNFASTYEASGLQAGTYSVCFEATDGTIVYEQSCFEVEISEPDALSVSSRVLLSADIVELELSGGSLYNIELNGIVTQTSDSKITLELSKGANALKVSTNLECQGIYEEQIIVSDKPILYPNPFINEIKAAFAANVGSVMVEVYSIEGRLMKRKAYQANGGEIEMDFSMLPTGLYHVVFEGKNMKATSKIVKQ